MNKALVLGTNYYIGLSIIRCLGEKNVRVVACDYDFKSSYGAKSKYVSEILHIEGLNDINKTVCDSLIEYAKLQEKKPVLYPSHDKYVEFIDNFYDELSEYFLISQKKGLNSILMDKWKLDEVAKKYGVKIPESININDDNLYDNLDRLGYPCMIKPTDTVIFTKIFRSKSFICETLEEVVTYVEKCKDKGIDAVVQEIIPGFDDCMETYDSYIDKNGITTHYMTGQKLRQWPINFGASVFTRQKYIEDAITIGKKFMEDMGYRGFSEIEFKRHSKTRELYLIEINVRTTNFNTLINKVGINMPYITYCDLTDKDMPKNLYLEKDTNTAFIYGFEDFFAVINYKRAGQQAISKSIYDTITKKWAPAIFSIKDMKPWFTFNAMIMKKIFNKLFRRKNV